MRSLTLATIAAGAAVVIATILVYGRRARPSRTGALAARVTTLGYAVPGTVVAVAVYSPFAWIDRRLSDLADAVGLDVGLILTGSAVGLVVAYLVRFHPLAYFALDARMARMDPSLDDAARGLGADADRVLSDIHLPLLWPGMTTAALLVFVEVMKELPATALLRPLGRRHAGHRGVGGDEGLALRHRRAPRAADRAARDRAGRGAGAPVACRAADGRRGG